MHQSLVSETTTIQSLVDFSIRVKKNQLGSTPIGIPIVCLTPIGGLLQCPVTRGSKMSDTKEFKTIRYENPVEDVARIVPASWEWSTMLSPANRCRSLLSDWRPKQLKDRVWDCGWRNNRSTKPWMRKAYGRHCKPPCLYSSLGIPTTCSFTKCPLIQANLNSSRRYRRTGNRNEIGRQQLVMEHRFPTLKKLHSKYLPLASVQWEDLLIFLCV